MTGELFDGKADLAEIAFRRSGDIANVLREDGTATENKYGKVSDTDKSYSKVGETVAKLMYGSYDERRREDSVQGGKVRMETPRVAVPKDSIAQEDDLVEMPDGERFQLDAKVTRETHNEFKATLLTK